MALLRSRISLATVMLAATAMTAGPLAAAELPLPSAAAPGAYDSHANDAYGHRRWGHSRDHISTGDVVAGVAIIGVLAAIAGAASNEDRRDREVYRETSREPYREPPRPARSWNNGGIDNAVDQCVSQVERGDDRVESVDNAARDASGWRVQGSLTNGDYFSCRLDNDGRIRAIDLGDDFAALDTSDAAQSPPQLSDQAYAQARAAMRSQPASTGIDGDIADEPRPAYPGGPLPGEEGYEDSFGG